MSLLGKYVREILLLENVLNSKMSKPEDAFRIDFRIVNDLKDSSKRTLVSPTENIKLQQFKLLIKILRFLM